MPEQIKEKTAKVFMAGRSQAVRLPKKHRFPDDCHEVTVRQIGKSLVLTPHYMDWDEMFEGLPPITDDFADAVLSIRNEAPIPDSPRVSFDE